jgi:hypothetical protein
MLSSAGSALSSGELSIEGIWTPIGGASYTPTRRKKSAKPPARVEPPAMDVISTLQDVRAFETNSGNTRYVARDADGNEYTTFREDIGERAKQLRGQRVRITYHETQRGRYTNVYLDKLEPAPYQGQVAADAAPSGSSGSPAPGDTDVQEAAWRTAVEAAPWLVGKPGQEVDPGELYEKLKPFEERVAEDIETGRE